MHHSRRRFIQASALNSALVAISGSRLQAGNDPAAASARDSAKHPSALLNRLSSRSRRALRFSADEAADAGYGIVDTDCLLVGLAAEAEYSGACWLSNLGMTLDDVCSVSKLLMVSRRQPQVSSGRLPVSKTARRCVADAVAEADRMGYQKAEPEHLLLGIVQNPDAGAHRILHEMWIDPATLEAEAITSMPNWGGVHHRFG